VKLTRGELNVLIKEFVESTTQNYLTEAKYLAMSSEMFAPQSCDFKPNKEFLEFFTVFFQSSRTVRSKEEDLPNWMSPTVFRAFTGDILPLLNMFGLIPVFNMKGKCDLLREIQTAFIAYKNVHEEGLPFDRSKGGMGSGYEGGGSDLKTSAEVVATAPFFISNIRQVLAREGIDRLPAESDSDILRISGSSSYRGITHDQVIFLSLLAGNLDNVTPQKSADLNNRLTAIRSPSPGAVMSATRLSDTQKDVLGRYLNSRDIRSQTGELIQYATHLIQHSYEQGLF